MAKKVAAGQLLEISGTHLTFAPPTIDRSFDP
jgi:hypothetical protein